MAHCHSPLFLKILKGRKMHETWELVKNIAQVISIFLMPIAGWVMWSIITHSKQIIVLEQKVNDSLNNRMTSLEDKVGSIQDKIDDVHTSLGECRLSINNLAVNSQRIEEKFDILIQKVDDNRWT